jgi:hypothetical protein
MEEAHGYTGEVLRMQESYGEDLAPLETMASKLHTTQAISSSHQVLVTTVSAWNMSPFVAIPLAARPDATSQSQPGSQAGDR